MQSALPQSFAVRFGRSWFQWRSLSPLPWFLLMIVLTPEFTLGTGGLVLTVAGIFLAEGLRLLSVGYAGSATRTRGDKVPQLVHSGPYRHVRNPLYIANIAMYSLCGVLFGFRSLAVGTFLYSCVQYTFIVAYEEELLRRTFGASYEEYTKRVPRWMPSYAPQVPSTPQTFDLASGLRSERSTLYCMTAVFLAFAIKRAFF